MFPGVQVALAEMEGRAMRTRHGLVIGVVLLGVIGVGCAGGGEAGDADSGSAGGAQVAPERAVEAFSAARAGNNVSSRGGAAMRLPTVGPSVIKTATVEVGVRDSVEEAVQKATGVAARFGGFVASTTTTSGSDASGTVMLRVPATDFEAALAAIQDLGKLERHSVSGEDVGQEFIDLQARLRNWQSQEAVLLDLMDRARTVSDTIRVQGELSQVQLEIERLRGRLNFLEDQTSFGTITATFAPVGAAPGNPAPLTRAWEQALDAGLSVVSAVIVGLGFALPVALLVGLVALAVRGLRPRLTQ